MTRGTAYSSWAKCSLESCSLEAKNLSQLAIWSWSWSRCASFSALRPRDWRSRNAACAVSSPRLSRLLKMRAFCFSRRVTTSANCLSVCASHLRKSRLPLSAAKYQSRGSTEQGQSSSCWCLRMTVFRVQRMASQMMPSRNGVAAPAISSTSKGIPAAFRASKIVISNTVE